MPANLKGYCPKGQTTVLKHSAKKFNINRISTVTNQGKVRLLIYDKKNGTSFDSFSEKVCLILDHLRINHAKLVKSWVQEDKEKIKLFHLPSDSPDLNPDQDLNCDLKTHPNQKSVPKKRRVKRVRYLD